MADDAPCYCFDTSAFIAAWVRMYPNAHFPSLWDRIETLVTERRLVAATEVRDELAAKDDDLRAWCRGREGLFVTLDIPLLLQAKAVLKEFPMLVDTSKGRGKADPFVIALALLRGAVVVTDEQPRPSNPRIPDVCMHLGVRYMTVLQVIRQEGWRF